MNNYLFPIKKLETKSWIKYWLSKREFNSYVLSQILTGTELYLENSVQKKFKIFKITGHSEQESTTGKNLSPNTLTSGSYHGVSYTVNEDKSITFNGTYSLSTNGWLRIGDNFTLPAGTYTISSGNTSASSSTALFVDDGNNFSRVNNQTKTFENDITIKPYIFIAVGATFNNFTIYPMIEQGSTATSYEPYTGGEPAPSPSYPYDIKSCGENVNEFDVDSYTRDSNYGGYVYNNGVFTFTPASTNENARMQFIIPKSQFVEGQDYSISAKGINRITVGYASSINDNYHLTYFNNTNDSKTIFTYSSIPDDYIIIAFWNTNSTFGEKWTLSNIKLEKGTQATPYSPYGCGNVNVKVQNANIWDEETRLGFYNDSGIWTNRTDILSSKNPIYVNSSNIHYFKAPSQVYYTQWKKDGTFISRTCISSGSGTFTLDSNCAYIHFNLLGGYGTTYNNDICINVSDENLNGTYVSHAEQNISFPLAQGQKLMEGDYLADDGVHHVRRKIVLDGSNDENWEKLTTTNTNYSRFRLINIGAINVSDQSQLNDIYCNITSKISAINTYRNTEGIAYNNTYNAIVIYLDETKSMSLTEFKAWLAEKYESGTPIIVEYKLAEEVIDPYTEEQQAVYDQIKEAYSYKGGTHISSPDEVKPKLEIQYYMKKGE